MQDKWQDSMQTSKSFGIHKVPAVGLSRSSLRAVESRFKGLRSRCMLGSLQAVSIGTCSIPYSLENLSDVRLLPLAWPLG